MGRRCMGIIKKYVLGNDQVRKYKKEIAEQNARTLFGLAAIGLGISLILLILSLPFVGILKLTYAFLMLSLLFGFAVLLSRKAFRRYPSLSMLLFYAIIMAMLSIAIYMGTFAGPDTTATTFIMLLLFLSLFIIDCPWHLILVNLVMVTIFCCCDIAVKPQGQIRTLDLTYAFVVLLLSSLSVIFSFQRSIERFAYRRDVEKLASERGFLINSLPVGVAVYEVHGTAVKQTYTNEQFYRLFEDDPESRAARTKGDFVNSIHPHDRAKLQRAMKSVIVEGKDYVSEICRSTKGDGTYLWVRFSSSVAKREGDYLLIYSTYESVEEEIKSKLATQAKTEFLSRMSHDIRTPMNAIIGLTHLAEEEKDMDVIQQYLGSIDATSDFLLGLINDILDLNKIESGQFELYPQPYAYHEFIQSVHTVIDPLLQKKHQQFICHVEENMPCILVDRLRLNQIVFNLLSNASKFTPEGGKIEFEVQRLGQRDGLCGIRVTIRDNGIGMSEDFQRKMFLPFVQEKNVTNGAVTGTGLGLPIVKSLMDAMGAAIRVQSAPGEGTEYQLEFYLPVTMSGESCQEEGKLPSLEGMKIMLVEDNDMNILVAQKMLEKQGCIIQVAKNGEQALHVFEASGEHEYQAILMDVRMPVMDGIEATRRIRALHRPDRDIPIIAMTADAFSEEQKKTINAGMNEHLSKPIVPEKLFRTLARLASM